MRIIDCTEPARLYRRYHRQSRPQPTYIELDLRAATLQADYNSEVGNAVPAAVFHGFQRRYPIPILTAEAANRIMTDLAPLADRVLADWEQVWDGSNHRARLGEDATAAEEHIAAVLGVCLDPASGAAHADTQGFVQADLVTVWDLDSAVNGLEAKEFDITPDTSDERLEKIAQQITSSLAEVSASNVVLVDGLDTYLRDLRDDIRS